MLVAVSGGPDSICLLHSLVRLRRLFALELSSFHFDHRLRPGSDRDAAYARRQAERLGVPFHLRAAASGPQRGESVEALGARGALRGDGRRAARGGRHDGCGRAHRRRPGRDGAALALPRWRDRRALGHAPGERGGRSSLAGREPRPDAGLLPGARPSASTRPGQRWTRGSSAGGAPREGDPRAGAPGSAGTCAMRSSEPPTLLREDADLLAATAEQATDGLIRMPAPGEVGILARGLNELPGPLASRIVRRALWSIGAQPDSAAIGTVVDLAAGRRGRSVALAGGLRAARTSEYVRVFRPSPGARARGDRPTDGEALHGDHARR